MNGFGASHTFGREKLIDFSTRNYNAPVSIKVDDHLGGQIIRFHELADGFDFSTIPIAFFYLIMWKVETRNIF